ncbi:MAG: SPOR domain-containing protein [Rhodoferax sp.]
MPDTAPSRTEPALDERTRADTSPEMATTSLWRAAIGPLQTDYYLRHFSAFDERDRTAPRWNSAAALCTLNWMLLRRMWSAALAYTGLVLTLVLGVFGIGKLVFHYDGEVEMALAALIGALWVLVPGLWGNAWLYKHLRHDMALAVGAQPNLEQAQAALLAQAPTRQRLLAVAGANAALASLAGAAVMWATSMDGMPAALSQRPPASAGPVLGASAAAATPEPPATAASAPAAPASAPASTPASTPATPVAPPSAPAAAQAANAPPAPTPTPASASAASRPGPTAVASAPAKALRPGSTRTPAAATPETAHSASASPRVAAKTAPPAARPAPAKPVAAKPATAKPEASAKAARAKPGASAHAASAHAGKAGTLPQAAPPQASAKAAPRAAYGVNVGLFANPDNARRASDTLQGAGLSVSQQTVKTSKGTVLQRVRVGPFESTAAAHAAAERIRALGLDAQVYGPKP